MAKFVKASEHVVNLFDEVRTATSIPRWIEFEVLANDKQKELYKINKLNEMVESLTELNFVVVVNESIFDELPEDMQKTALDECLAGVKISDTDAVSLDKPNFSTYRGVLEKYGHESIIKLHESIKSLFDSKKQLDDEEKARTKSKGGKQKKSF